MRRKLAFGFQSDSSITSGVSSPSDSFTLPNSHLSLLETLNKDLSRVIKETSATSEAEFSNLAPPQVVLDRLKKVMPEWVDSWYAHSTETHVRVWVGPKSGVVEASKMNELLKLAQDAIYPLPLTIELPPTVHSIDGRDLPRIYTFITSRSPEVVERDLKPSRKRLNNEELSEEIRRTLPLEVSLLRPVHYRMSLPHGRMDFVVLRVHVPPHKEADLRQWREHFEREHGVSVFFSRYDGFKGIQAQLKHATECVNLLTRRNAPAIEQCIEAICGEPPSENGASPEVRKSCGRQDLQHIRFVALDADGVGDREDLIYAERLSSGNIRVLVAFIDVTDFVEPGSERDRFAQRVGHTIYGSRRTYPTLGRKLAHTLAHFALNEVRPAWVAEIILDGVTGEDLTSHWPRVLRADVKAHTYMNPEEFARNVGQARSEHAEITNTIALASSLLHQQRMNSHRLLRIDGDSVGHEVLAEMMIAAKTTIGRFLDRTGMPAIWRVHAAPSAEQKQGFVQQLQKLSIPASESHFDDPLSFAVLLRSLEDLESPVARALARQILDTFLLKTTFSTRNEGHYGLGLSHYLEIKPRDASGIRNQHQLDAAFGEGKEIPLADLEHCALWRNARKVRDDERRYKLRFFEMLGERLQSDSVIHEVTVREERKNFVLVDVPGFSRWGYISKPRRMAGEERAAMPPGFTFQAALDGFSVERMRFKFSPLAGHGTQPASDKQSTDEGPLVI